MKSILLIVACILMIILAISKCNIIKESTEQKTTARAKRIKKAYRLLPEEARIWLVRNY